MKQVTDNTNHLKTLLNQLADFPDAKVRSVASIKHLLEMTAKVGVKLPYAGIMYEGARATGDQKTGASGEMVFSVLLVAETSVISNRTDLQPYAHELLDEMRATIQGTRATTGHLWKWVLEAPVKHEGSVSIWVQRWSTPFAVTPRKAIGSAY